VVGRPNGRALRRANAQLEERLGVPVQITAVTPQEWDKPTSRFLLEVQHRPHLTVLIGDELINILTPVVDKILSAPE
jgi:hypothetical protein